MSHIVLTEEQSRVLAQAEAPVEVRGSDGKWLGRLDPKEAEIVAGVLRDRQTKAARVRAEKVEEHLHALQTEWDRTGGFDHDHMARFLEKLRAEDRE